MSYDEPKILSSQLNQFCLMGADVGHVVHDDLEATLASLRTIRNMAGVMITVPHKPLAAKSSVGASDRARVAGAANALRPVEGGWEADLLDGEGFAIGLGV